MKQVLDLIPLGLGLIFFITIALAFKDWNKWKRIDKLNRLLYGNEYEKRNP